MSPLQTLRVFVTVPYRHVIAEPCPYPSPRREPRECALVSPSPRRFPSVCGSGFCGVAVLPRHCGTMPSPKPEARAERMCVGVTKPGAFSLSLRFGLLWRCGTATSLRNHALTQARGASRGDMRWCHQSLERFPSACASGFCDVAVLPRYCGTMSSLKPEARAEGMCVGVTKPGAFSLSLRFGLL